MSSKKVEQEKGNEGHGGRAVRLGWVDANMFLGSPWIPANVRLGEQRLIG